MLENITIRGARTHNLKNINVDIPKNKLVVITGVSGSGKSSLAFDTIYAEGQRRYVESLSAYARQFLDLMEKPDVDYIAGLSPAISIDQKSAGRNPRSTVGTITEIYDYLRLLFARVGHPYCPNGHGRVEAQSVQKIVDLVLQRNSVGTKIMILSPIIRNRKGTYEELFNRLSSEGYTRARVDGEIKNFETDIVLDRYKQHNIEVIIDRLIIKEKGESNFTKRLTDSIETAINLSEGEVIISREKESKWIDELFSEKFACSVCHFSFPEIEPHSFSFNSPYGACPHCTGLGIIKEIDPKLIYNPNLTISEGAIFPWARSADNENSWTMQFIKSIAEAEGFSTRIPMGKLPAHIIDLILYGSKGKKYTINYTSGNRDFTGTIEKEFEGVIPNLMRRYNETDSEYIRKEIDKYMRELVCPVCKGKRLKPESLAITILNKNIHEVSNLTISQTKKWIELLNTDASSIDSLSNQEKEISQRIIKEILVRLDFLIAVGLEYLTLSRSAKTLSGGESQRIRLASQIGSGLTGVLYVLDEPSIGLHQRDNARLLTTLKNLRDLGNTVIVVEHDEEIIRAADYIIDIGPLAGEYGGEVVVTGTINDVMHNQKSITGEYLSGKKRIDKANIQKDVKRILNNNKYSSLIRKNSNQLKNSTCKRSLFIKGAKHNNLKNIDVEIPLGKFIAITGVSGSGKSSLINDILYKSVAAKMYQSKSIPGQHECIEGIENIDKVVNIDQSPIGRTPRSNPATYTGVFTPIRELFSKTKEARIRGYSPGRFSFNVKGGRCENCHGDGQIKIEMQFLPDIYITCEVCKGKRYNREALQIDYNGKNISDVLDMTVHQALVFFENIPTIKHKLQTLTDVGLGYIRLGQSALTLSGGEAQRVKLATELAKRQTGRTLYLLDEPTTGLHFDDVYKLLIVLHSLVAMNNTVIVIEHNLDVIRTSDWIIDLGPEGGENGGEVIATGTPEEISKVEKSYTGQWIRKIDRKVKGLI